MIAGVDPTVPEFWEDLVEAQGLDKVNEKCLKPETWDKAASTYDDLEKCKDYLTQVTTVIDILQQKGALDKENVVLDVACGTGSYSVRMAPYCKKVTCVDISSGMLEKLKEKTEAYGLKNVEVVQADWQSFEPRDKFDLVFCSMTPLLRTPVNLKKILDTSSRYIGIVTWAGVRKNPLLQRLSKQILGKEIKNRGQDIHFVFNYLYSLGHAPNLYFFTGCWEKIRSANQQAESLIWRLEMKRTLNEKEKEVVRQEVKRFADENGMVKLISQVRTCFMFIDKTMDKQRDWCPGY